MANNPTSTRLHLHFAFRVLRILEQGYVRTFFEVSQLQFQQTHLFCDRNAAGIAITQALLEYDCTLGIDEQTCDEYEYTSGSLREEEEFRG